MGKALIMIVADSLSLLHNILYDNIGGSFWYQIPAFILAMFILALETIAHSGALVGYMADKILDSADIPDVCEEAGL